MLPLRTECEALARQAAAVKEEAELAALQAQQKVSARHAHAVPCLKQGLWHATVRLGLTAHECCALHQRGACPGFRAAHVLPATRVRSFRSQALQDVQAAQLRVEELEQQLLCEREEKESLQSAMAQIEAELAEACAAHEAKAAALSLVQSGGRVAAVAAAGGHPAAGPGSPSKQHASVAVLSQHLLEASLAQVEATKQLRVAEK